MARNRVLFNKHLEYIFRLVLNLILKYPGPASIKATRAVSLVCWLLLLCSCTTTRRLNPPGVPAEISFNQGAGRGDFILVTLRLENGDALPFVIDTGCIHTILDQSLDSKLGRRTGVKTLNYGWYGKVRSNIYKTPKLYLGNLGLLMDDQVFTDDLEKKFPGQSIKGILGMDCLEHYCIQLDFTAGKMRFLDPGCAGDMDLGRSYPLTVFRGCIFCHADFFGAGKAYFRPDTGGIGDYDAVFKPGLFQRELRQQTPALIGQSDTDPGKSRKMALFLKGTFGGDGYTNMTFIEWEGIDWSARNIIGLQFLARNLVTFNFPKRTMYLKQASIGPLAPGYFLTLEAGKFLLDLKAKNQLPGFPKNDVGQAHMPEAVHGHVYPISATFDVRKKDNKSIYHYTVSQPSRDGVWKLLRAWQSDTDGHIINEFSLP